MHGTDALALHEELGKVLRLSVSHSPLHILNLEDRSLLLSFFIRGWLLCFSIFLSFNGFLCHNDFWLWENFVLDLELLNVFLRCIELKSDNSLDFSDLFLNSE
mgnify:CR=1 FL=1